VIKCGLKGGEVQAFAFVDTGKMPGQEIEVVIAAKDDGARAFYEHFTFESSPSDPYHLLLIMKDLMQIIGR
jgi:hypothetical protein